MSEPTLDFAVRPGQFDPDMAFIQSTQYQNWSAFSSSTDTSVPNKLLWFRSPSRVWNSNAMHQTVDDMIKNYSSRRSIIVADFLLTLDGESESKMIPAAKILKTIVARLVSSNMSVWKRLNPSDQRLAVDLLGPKSPEHLEYYWHIIRGLLPSPKEGTMVIIIDSLDAIQERDRDRFMQGLDAVWRASEGVNALRILVSATPFQVFDRWLGNKKIYNPNAELTGKKRMR